jgi:hypothetical protein
VYVTTLTTGGSGNTLALASITGSATFPATIPLISYEGVAAPNFVLSLPSGYYGYIVNNSGNHTIDAVISTTPPQNLVWNGNLSGDWDFSTANWQGGLQFVNGDAVVFDDSASGNTTITIPSEVTLGSGGVLVSNVTKSYTERLASCASGRLPHWHWYDWRNHRGNQHRVKLQRHHQQADHLRHRHQLGYHQHCPVRHGGSF